MNKEEVLNYLSKNIKFNSSEIEKLDVFQKELLKFNDSYNLIGSSTLNDIWTRHILDSAQIIKFIDFNKNNRDRKSTRLNSSHPSRYRMPSSA